MYRLPAFWHSQGVRLAVLLCMICAPYHLATAGTISGCVPYWFPTTSPSANISTGTCSGSFDITKPTVVYDVTMTTPTTVKIDANAYSAALRYQGSSQYGLWHAIIDGGTFSPGLTVDLRNGARLLIRNVKVINGANPIILSVASGSTLVIANSTIDDSVVLTCKEWSTCIFVGNSITTAAWDGQLLIFWQVTTRSQAILMHNYLACAGGAACEIQWGWDVSSNSHVLLRENVLQAHTVPYSFLATASVVASYYDAWEGPVDYGAKTIASCVRTNAKVPYPLGFCSPNCAAGFHCDVRRAGVTSSTDGTQCACNCIDTLDALAGRPGSAPQFCTMPTEVDDYICGTLVGKHPGGQPMPHTPTVPLSRSASYATSPTGTLTHTATITPPRTPTRSATLTTPPTRTRTRTRTVTGTTSTTLPKADNRTHAPTVQRAPTSTPPPTPAPPATPVPSSAAGNDTAPPPEATAAPSNSSAEPTPTANEDPRTSMNISVSGGPADSNQAANVLMTAGFSDRVASATLAAATTSAVLASIAGPVASARASRVGAVAQLARCLDDGPPDPAPSPSLLELPFLITVGSSPLKLVSGPVLVAAIVQTVLLAAHYVLFFKTSASRTVIQWTSGLAAPIWLAYFSPTISGYAAMLLVARAGDADAVDKAVGVVSMAVVLATLASVAFTAHVQVPRHVTVGQSDKDGADEVTKPCFVNRAQPESTAFTECFGAWFDGARDIATTMPRAYVFIDLFVAVASAFLTALDPGNVAVCHAVSAVLVVLAVAYLWYFGFVRPFRSRLETAFSVINGLLQLALAGVLTIMVFKGDTSLMPVAGWCIVLLSLMFFGQAVTLTAWAVLKSHVRCAAPSDTTGAKAPLLVHPDRAPAAGQVIEMPSNPLLAVRGSGCART
jgi:hypothetical protein